MVARRDNLIESLNDLTARVEAYRTQLSSHRASEFKDTHNAIHSTKEETERKQSNITHLQTEFLQRQSELDLINEHIAASTTDLAAITTKLHDTEHSITELKHAINNITDEINNFVKECITEDHNSDQLKVKLGRQIDELKQVLHNTTHEYNILEASFLTYQKEHQLVQRTHTVVQNTFTDTESYLHTNMLPYLDTLRHSNNEYIHKHKTQDTELIHIQQESDRHKHRIYTTKEGILPLQTSSESVIRNVKAAVWDLEVLNREIEGLRELVSI